MQKRWDGDSLKRVVAVALAISMAVSLATCDSGGVAAKTSEARSAPEDNKEQATAASSETPTAETRRRTTADSGGRYGKVTVAPSNGSQDLAPHAWAGNHSKQYIYYDIYEALFDFRGGEYIPIMAKGYENVNKTHTRVTLYDNIYDIAGNQIKTQNVVSSVGLIVDSGDIVKYDIFDSVKAVDDYTVEYTWTGPIKQVGALKWPWCRTMIVSQKSYGGIGGFADKPIGTDPYTISEYVSGSYLTLVANDRYWQSEELRDTNRKANVQTVEYGIIAEASQHVIALNTDQVRCSQAVPAENLADFAEGRQYADRYGMFVTQGSEVYVLIPNCTEGGLMSDVSLRKAIFYTLNNNAIAAATGTCVVAKTFGAPFFDDCDPAWESTKTYMNTYDLEEAKEHLGKSGYNGKTIPLEGFNRGDLKSTMAMIQALLLQARINAEINSRENALVQSGMDDSKTWDLLLWNPGGGTQMEEWNWPIDCNRFGTGFSMAFLHDDTLQELFETANTAEGHDKKNMAKVHDYTVKNTYCHALCMPEMNATYSKEFADLMYRESEFLLPGACDYHLDQPVKIGMDHIGKCVLKRPLQMIVIVLGTAFIIFIILYFTSGGPAVVITGGNAFASDITLIRIKVGTDRPYPVQLGSYFYNTFIRMDFGNSWVYDKPAYQEMLVRLPCTILIGVSAMVLNLGLDLYLGIFATTHEGRWQDSLTIATTTIFISCPDFWVALMMILLFSAKLGWLPSYGVGGPQYYVVPVVCSVLDGITVSAHRTRVSMLEIFHEDYVTTARTKGQREKMVVLKHMLPSALMPIITSIGAGSARIVAGSAVIESVFSVPDMGLYILNAINMWDYPVVRACILFFAIFTALVMSAVDLICTLVDLRIKAQYSGVKKRRAVKA